MVGCMSAEDMFDKSVDFDLTGKYQEGEIFKAKVKKIDVKKFKVDLTKRP
jgi:transcriptional accessory protein Tex/SPT6